MAYTTINKSSDFFNTKIYTGNGSTNAITGVGFKPDWVWVKDRTSANNHGLFDIVRGVTKALVSNENYTTITNANYLQSFDTDGFTLGSEGAYNTNTNSYASWNWLANGQGSANTDGSINTTYTSANTTAGFSICKWTGTGSAATIGHGLGAVPKMIIVKTLDSESDWIVYHGANTSAPETDYIMLNQTNATGDSSGVWNDTAPTSSVFSVGTAGSTNGSSKNMIAYCFAEKTGYSKFGSWTGNGNADGPFVYTGFKPAFILSKRSDTGDTSEWYLVDNKRVGYNPNNYAIYPNLSNAENTTERMDFLSNGFKLRQTSIENNASGGTYIYAAFAAAPLVGSNNVPCTAR